MHTHILVQTSQFTFRAREPLRVERPDRTRRRPSHAHSHAVIFRPFCSSKPYHEPLHFSISISRNSDARGFVA